MGRPAPSVPTSRSVFIGKPAMTCLVAQQVLCGRASTRAQPVVLPLHTMHQGGMCVKGAGRDGLHTDRPVNVTISVTINGRLEYWRNATRRVTRTRQGVDRRTGNAWSSQLLMKGFTWLGTELCGVVWTVFLMRALIKTALVAKLWRSGVSAVFRKRMRNEHTTFPGCIPLRRQAALSGV